VILPDDPSFHVWLAFLLGMIGQVAARHLRVPGIVVLLGLGVAAGPDGLGLLRPETLGDGLSSLVAFAVAIILFEGGMALDLREAWDQGRVIRRLVTVGALVTAVGAGLAVHLLLGWEGPPAVLFGTLVIVTGPTVIQPLVRRIRVSRRVATILEGEAIFGDAIGATLAVVALELSVAPGAESFAHGWLGLAERFGFGILLGLAAGAAILLAVRFEKAVPSEIRNALSLAILLGFYQLADALRSKSGILVAITAGLMVRNVPGLRARGLKEFKEELTVLLLGLLFVLLAADVRLAEIESLGWAGIGVVAVLMFAVRPLNVAIATAGSGLSFGERGFLAWLAPRGIVAAAVASYFAEVFESEGIERGPELRALVFLVIAVTVTVQGLTGGWVARGLGVARGPRAGWAILGANGLGLALAERLGGKDELVLVDASADRCHEARKRGFRVVEANALDESTLFHPEVESRKRFVAVTPNEEVNFIFARRAHELLKATELWVALRRHHQGIRPDMIEEIRARTLFGRESRLDIWALRLERGLVEIETRVADKETEPMPETESADGTAQFLPLVLRRSDTVAPYSDGKPRAGDRVELAIFRDRAAEARAALAAAGWRPAAAEVSAASA
jgi:NhaP-type Na+/H+ or K+/H+ antiporter